MNKTILKNTIIRVAIVLLIPLIVLGLFTLLGEWVLFVIFIGGIALIGYGSYQKEKKDYEFRKKRSLYFHYQYILDDMIENFHDFATNKTVEECERRLDEIEEVLETFKQYDISEDNNEYYRYMSRLANITEKIINMKFH
jgi:hypothetical protein